MLECQDLTRNARDPRGPLTPRVKHLHLKRKRKSATLRAERPSAPGGQAARAAAPQAGARQKPATPASAAPLGTGRAASRTPLQRERAVKLLAPSEPDLVGASRAAQRRRKTLDAEGVGKPAKEETAVENATRTTRPAWCPHRNSVPEHRARAALHAQCGSFCSVPSPEAPPAPASWGARLRASRPRRGRWPSPRCRQQRAPVHNAAEPPRRACSSHSAWDGHHSPAVVRAARAPPGPHRPSSLPSSSRRRIWPSQGSSSPADVI
ncbi:uncharacterized protein LOC142862468 [Microcebus murinus]|uniref:uncharacterized protein LOC142862468 n=1 Tax=Microcebus murinus TaxID=30608 RepID=UPI003F6A9F11